MMRTQKAFDTYTFAQEMDLDQYSLLIACGGDGSYHEVVNGMLARADGKKIAVGFLPNGSGNDTLRSFEVYTLDSALDLICNGEVTHIDTVKFCLDAEDDSAFDKSE